MISSGADCLRYRSGQDFRSISRYCLIDSSPNSVVDLAVLCGCSAAAAGLTEADDWNEIDLRI